jgi:hypothetical protein
MTRLIPLQGVENLRDYGDYAAGAGRLKKGVLFRAAHQAEATDEDLDAWRPSTSPPSSTCAAPTSASGRRRGAGTASPPR